MRPVRYLTSELLGLMNPASGRGNARVLVRFVLALVGVIAVYSTAFHYIMEWEGREHSWVTGVYWTLTVMSTLGFGDITFESDLGRAFSIFVLLTGTVFLLVLLPFIFIQFFWAPWMQAQSAARAPRKVASDVEGHVLLTSWDEVTRALGDRLDRRKYPYFLVVAELEEALRLHDLGVSVVVGELDDPETWVRVGVERAGLVAATSSDVTNTNIAFTVRGVSENVPIVGLAEDPASVDVLQLAGCNRVLELPTILGRALARRTIGGDAMTHVIGQLGPLLFAEATAARTPLVGKSLRDAQLREKTGLSAVGVWERGRFSPPNPETEITANTVLVLAGTREQLDRYDELFVIYNVSGAPALILGGGRVGEATAQALAERDIDYRVVEKDPNLIRDGIHYVLGSAAELEVLNAAGIMETPAVLITTNDDDTNVYLTIYCRRLRPDVQIITRTTLERNVASLHRAGTDFVMSYASMGANILWNFLQRSEVLMLAEGLDLFKVPVPAKLAGRTLADSSIRERTGASLVAIVQGEEMQINPDAETKLPEDAEIILIGSVETEGEFQSQFS